MKQHKTYVETIGPKGHRRCRIAGEQGYWNGEDWSHDPRHALLYHDFQQAARDLRLVELYENFDKPSTESRATVSVTVFGEQRMDTGELGDFLTEATKLSLVKPSPNGEPVLIQIHWDQLELVSEAEGLSDE